jgi:hypothetical protein
MTMDNPAGADDPIPVETLRASMLQARCGVSDSMRRKLIEECDSVRALERQRSVDGDSPGLDEDIRLARVRASEQLFRYARSVMGVIRDAVDGVMDPSILTQLPT